MVRLPGRSRPRRGPAGVLVLSALHGFVQLDDVLLPYEQRMDAPGHVSVEQLRAPRPPRSDLAARDLVALSGRAYVDAVRPDTLRPLDGLAKELAARSGPGGGY
ncbi:hypothetical protein ACFYO2_41935 [Streptomyces sp. NPDC006602]|uniref:hypothetical protein n=1 Tax=Streptomyces sp. NPDC006602 TaxID=3364751 RepID=UPI0036A1ECE2